MSGSQRLRLNGDYANTGTLNPGTGTVEMTGGGNQTLSGTAPLTFYRLTINKDLKTETVIAASKLKVLGKTMITKGKLISASDYLDMHVDTDGTLALTSNITIGGNLIVTGTLQSNGHTITCDGTTGQTIGGTGVMTFTGLTISNTVGVTVTAGVAVTGTLDLHAGNLNVTGPALDLSGTSTGEGDVVGSTRRSDLVSNTPYAFGNGMVGLNFGVGGTVPGAVTVTLALTAPTGITNSILRTYNITQTGGSGFTTTLRLHYLQSDLRPGMVEGSLKLYRRESGGGWTEVPVTDRDIVANWLESNNVSQFSDWTAGNGTPTAVEMRRFKARSGS